MSSSKIKLPSNKKFGFFFCSVFSILSIYAYFSELPFLTFILGFIAIILLILTLWSESKLEPFNYAWMRLGVFIGIIISPIVLGSIFFLIFTPVAIVMRIFKRDELTLNTSKKSSYWIDRKEKIYSESFKYQF